MTDLSKRTTAIQELSERFASEASALTDSLVSDLQLARGAVPGHIDEATALLQAWSQPDAIDGAVHTGDRRATGAVALSLHPDAPLTSFARTLPAAFLAGANQCVVNLPQGAKATANLLDTLCDGIPGVIVSCDPTGTFLFRALTDAFTRTVWAGGAEDLFTPLEALMADTRSHVVFEGWGNDPFIVADGADLDAAAARAADAVFRNGGIDPAAPNRIYVPASQHDDFCDKLCDLAAAYEIAHHNDAACSITPLRDGVRDPINDWLDEAEDADAELAVGLDFRNFPKQSNPTLYPTVVTGCQADLRIVTTRCRGPVVSVVPYSDDAELLTFLDMTAGPDGQVGAAAMVEGGGPRLFDELSRRVAHVLGQGSPFDAAHALARLSWGGGPASWTVKPGPSGLEKRFGPVSLTHAFSRDALTSRARWRSRTEQAAAAR